MTPEIFVHSGMPQWLSKTLQSDGSVIEALDKNGMAVEPAARGSLTQARTIFTLAHLYQVSGKREFLDGAIKVHGYLKTNLRHADGGYMAELVNDLRRTYDQTFVLLAFVTLQKSAPHIVSDDDVEACWSYISQKLTDPETGTLFEDSTMALNGAKPGDLRAQNPHMHLLEALLQAFEMTGDAKWMERADKLLDAALPVFLDPETGAVREFTGRDLTFIDTAEGKHVEPGHQYEWAWLLRRYHDLGGRSAVLDKADSMLAFAEKFGLRPDGPMRGAPYDALTAKGDVTAPHHLLWPLTEMGKVYARQAADGHDDAKHRVLEVSGLIFDRYFDDGPEMLWVNQLDASGRPVWTEALTRLLYHVAIFVTEGARARMWQVSANP